MVDLRTWRGESFEQISDLWCRSAPRDPITAHRFRTLFVLDPSFDPDGLRLAFDGDVLVGASYAVRRALPLHGDDLEPESGWLLFHLVAPEHRSTGIGRRMLVEQLSWLREAGTRTTYFSSYTPNYFLPGLDPDAYPAGAALLRSAGFEVQYECVAMDRSLVDYEMPDQVRTHVDNLRSRGYDIRSAVDEDLIDLIVLARDEFNPDWGRAIREACSGGLPSECILIVRDPDGRLIGWAMHGTYENATDRFGPFGVLEDRRGTGIGRALLHLTLQHMRASGGHTAWFLWTEADSAAGHLYQKTGFQITRRFHVLRHTIPATDGKDPR